MKKPITLKEEPKRAVAADEPVEKYMTVQEVADFTRTSEAAIRLHLSQEVLTRYKFFGRTLIKFSEVENLIKKA
jgi:hypothetical protein